MLVRTRKPGAGRRVAMAMPRAQRVPADGELNPRIARLLQLQRTAGNRALARALSSARGNPKIQRLGWPSWEDVVDAYQWTNPLTFGQKAIRHFTGTEVNLWEIAEMTVRASASKISIPSDYVDKLKAYAAYNTDDGEILKDALSIGPSHYKGGVLVGANSSAAAMTFGNSIFYADTPSVDTFIHEMVHIHQYHVLGRSAFLASYFGLSLATIVKRLLAGQSLDVMSSSPHEQQAYNLEARFKAWRQSHP
jgi:hypothetical protein